MKRILVDMDGVLADIYSRYFQLHEEEYGVRLTEEEVAGIKEPDAFPGERRWVNTPGFFRTVPVVTGCNEVMRKLNEKYEVIIISSATEFPESLSDKCTWALEHFPFISWKQLVFCGDKSLIDADIMIDDHLKNLDNFRGKTLMFTQPHNKKEETRHKRVSSWKEIENLLLKE